MYLCMYRDRDRESVLILKFVGLLWRKQIKHAWKFFQHLYTMPTWVMARGTRWKTQTNEKRGKQGMKEKTQDMQPTTQPCKSKPHHIDLTKAYTDGQAGQQNHKVGRIILNERETKTTGKKKSKNKNKKKEQQQQQEIQQSEGPRDKWGRDMNEKTRHMLSVMQNHSISQQHHSLQQSTQPKLYKPKNTSMNHNNLHSNKQTHNRVFKTYTTESYCTPKVPNNSRSDGKGTWVRL